MEGKRFILLLSTAVLGAGLVFPAQDEAEPPAPAAAEGTVAESGTGEADELDAPDEKLLQARKLVLQLGDESYRVREEATKGLWGLGEIGIVAIREGMETDDPEVAHR